MASEIITTPVGVKYDPDNSQYPFWNSDGSQTDPRAIIDVVCNKRVVGGITTYTWRQQHANLSIDEIIAQEFSTKDGATFTPAVNNGVLSWTNDAGLPNPPPVNITGPRGEPGKDGAQGFQGPQGQPGFSPTVQLTPYEGGTQVTITDATGSNIFNVPDGAVGPMGPSPDINIVVNVESGNAGLPEATVVRTGEDSAPIFTITFRNLQGIQGETGEDGFSPAISIQQESDGHTVTVTDANGSKSFKVENGKPGYTPTITTAEIAGGHSVSITQESGTDTINVMDGTNGTDGAAGPQGAPGKDAPVPTPQANITAEGELGVTVTVSGTDEAPIWTFNFTGMTGTGGGGGTVPAISATAKITENGGAAAVEVTRTGTDEAPAFEFDFQNIKGKDGTDGTDGTNGTDGADGFSPSVSLSQEADGILITVTNKDGDSTAKVLNGANGYSPDIMSTPIAGGHRIDIANKDGSESFDVLDGKDGKDGANGIGASASVQEITGGHRVTIDSASGTTAFDVLNGETGASGPTGPQGATPQITITATQDGSDIPVTKTGTDAAPTFNFQLAGGSAGVSKVHFLPTYNTYCVVEDPIPARKTVTALITNGNNSSSFAKDTCYLADNNGKVMSLTVSGANDGQIRIGGFASNTATGRSSKEIPSGTYLYFYGSGALSAGLELVWWTE